MEKIYKDHLEALAEMQPGELKDVRIGDNIVTLKKGSHQEYEPRVSLTDNLTSPTKKAKVIIGTVRG